LYAISPNSPAAFWRKLRLTLEMIKFEHSVFALPFALTAALLARREIDLPWHGPSQ
jgi:4-hydroxybenzoate polyprenyltransferase